MTIRNVGNPYGSAAVGPLGTPPKGSASQAVEPASPPPPPPPRSDSVQISDAGRALAGAEGGSRAEGLTPERVADLRRKVLEGAYNSVEVVDQVAQRILKSGDLG